MVGNEIPPHPSLLKHRCVFRKQHFQWRMLCLWESAASVRLNMQSCLKWPDSSLDDVWVNMHHSLLNYKTNCISTYCFFSPFPGFTLWLRIHAKPHSKQKKLSHRRQHTTQQHQPAGKTLRLSQFLFRGAIFKNFVCIQDVKRFLKLSPNLLWSHVLIVAKNVTPEQQYCSFTHQCVSATHHLNVTVFSFGCSLNLWTAFCVEMVLYAFMH